MSAFQNRWLRRITGCLILGCVLLLVGYVFRAPLLTGLAEAWVVNDPVTNADAIVIPGGGLENRPFAAAKLFRNGIAPDFFTWMSGPARLRKWASPRGSGTDPQNPIEQWRPGNGHDHDW